MIIDIVLLIITVCVLVFSPVRENVSDSASGIVTEESAPVSAADNTEDIYIQEEKTEDLPEEILKNKEQEKADTPGFESASERVARDYEEAGVDELNSVPILMYHRVYEMSNAETLYTGGNVDPDGYNRTSEALEQDLEQYYEWGYRMIRLDDFLNGNIDVGLGYSPIIITFDDGLDQAKIIGFDESGYPLFSDYSALAVLENVKRRHPDFNVTATFFLNGGLFGNSYDDDVRLINWMVDNGYDIGNHTWTHAYLDQASAEEIEAEVGRVYKLLNDIIPGRYVNIVALPFGIPGDPYSDAKYQYIYEGSYEGFDYNTKASLMCAWTRQYCPFNSQFDSHKILRIRGYDADGQNCDIEQNFAQLNSGLRYISDGDPDTIVIHEEDRGFLGETFGKKIITY